jgi:hypothetical protein
MRGGFAHHRHALNSMPFRFRDFANATAGSLPIRGYPSGKEFTALCQQRAEPTKTGFLGNPVRVCVCWQSGSTQLASSPLRMNKRTRAVRVKRQPRSRAG